MTTAHSNRHTILLAEDDPPIRQLVRRTLEAEGYLWVGLPTSRHRSGQR